MLRHIFKTKDLSLEQGEKVGLQVVPATNQYFQYFLFSHPLKTTNKCQIGRNRLFLGDFGFQNSQIGQIIDWTYVNG